MCWHFDSELVLTLFAGLAASNSADSFPSSCLIDAYFIRIGTEDADFIVVSTSKQTNSRVSVFALAETANNSLCSSDFVFVSPSPSFTLFSTIFWLKGTLNGGTRMRFAFASSKITPPDLQDLCKRRNVQQQKWVTPFKPLHSTSIWIDLHINHWIYSTWNF